MIKIDFYESGAGETTIVTFPSGGIGVIDAHPSQSLKRPDIIQLTKNKEIHFVCLTHPHADHAADLVKLQEKHQNNIKEFWHTVPSIQRFFYTVSEYKKYPASEMNAIIKQAHETEAKCLIDLFHGLTKKRHLLRNDLQPKNIDGVDIYVLSPSEKIMNQYEDSIDRHLDKKGKMVKNSPDPNNLSAVLYLRYGEFSIIFGGDAKKSNWFDVVDKHLQEKLTKAGIIKVPHHGSRNAYNFTVSQKRQYSYLTVCRDDVNAVIFAGDSRHPNIDVFRILGTKHPLCLNNGLLSNISKDPLNLSVPGFQSVDVSSVCNPTISFECNKDGKMNLLHGTCSRSCTALQSTLRMP